MIHAVPMPAQGFRVDIVSLPESWLRLGDQALHDQEIRRTLERIGLICQLHIRNIMMGVEPGKDGQIVQFLHQSGRGRDSIQWRLDGNSVEIYADQRTKTPGGTSYLVYQEHGVSTQPMRWLVGKTIPWKVIAGGVDAARINPRTGTVVQGVSRVKFAGKGSKYWGDEDTKFTTITEAVFSKPSEYNPTGYRWWHPGYPGKHFFRDGVIAGVKEAADAIQGLAFRVAGGGPTPQLGTDLTGPETHFTPEYQAMLDELERTMEAEGVFPYGG